MNKTVNINLGGMFFHIDEDAYQKLSRYFDAIKRSLSNSNGQDEIIKDIEMRIAELISEKHTNDKQVINLRELDEVIAVMGQPEDYRLDTDGDEPAATSYNSSPKGISKKLYRDKENGMIGGVLAGLGHYFGIDKVWLRLLLLVMIFAGGTGVLAYIILWIVMPEAVTTAEKLEMKGEPVTISTIERKVREEFDTVSEKLKNVDYDKMSNQVKTGAERLTSSISEVLNSVFKVFAKVLGVIIIISALPVLVVLLIGVFTLGSVSFIKFPWTTFIEAGNFSDFPIWSFGILMFFAVGIPFFFLALLGFKLLTPNLKSIGTIAKSTLLALWLIAIALCITIGINQASAYAIDGRVVEKKTINLAPTDTLFVKFKYNDYFAKNVDEHNDFKITQDSTNANVIYSNEVSIKIMKTDEKLPYLQIEKEAKGKSLSEAKLRAKKINYGYKIFGNHLILDNYLLADLKNKYRDQEVEITLYLPKGTLFKADASLENYDRSEDDFFNLHFSSDRYIYRVNDDKVVCLNCPEVENEYNDVEINSDNDTISEVLLKINGNIDYTKKTKTESLSIDKKGVVIKK